MASLGFAQTVLFAILAPLGREVGLVEVQIGAIISSSSLTIFLTAPHWGRASDVYGRRRILLIGLFGYTFGNLLFAAVFQVALWGLLLPLATFVLLTVARILNAVVLAASMPSSNAYMADITSVAERTKGMAALGAANNIGSMLGPAVGGLLTQITLLTPLYFSSLLTLAGALMALFALPELPRTAPTEKPRRLKYTDRRILPYVVVGVTMFMAFALVHQTIAFRFQDTLGLDGAATAQVTGIALMASAAASLFAQMVVIPRLDLAPLTLLRLSLPVMLASFTTLVLGTNAWLLGFGMVLLGLGLGFGGPGFVAGASLAVSAEEQGRVAGVSAACPPLGFTLGPLLGTYLYSLDPTWPYWFAGLIYVGLSLYLLSVRSQQRGD